MTSVMRLEDTLGNHFNFHISFEMISVVTDLRTIRMRKLQCEKLNGTRPVQTMHACLRRRHCQQVLFKKIQKQQICNLILILSRVQAKYFHNFRKHLRCSCCFHCFHVK